MEKYTDFLDDKEQFAEKMGKALQTRALSALKELKKDVANELMAMDDEDESE